MTLIGSLLIFIFTIAEPPRTIKLLVPIVVTYGAEYKNSLWNTGNRTEYIRQEQLQPDDRLVSRKRSRIHSNREPQSSEGSSQGITNVNKRIRKNKECSFDSDEPLEWSEKMNHDLIKMWYDTSPDKFNHSSRLHERWNQMYPQYAFLSKKYLKRHADRLTRDVINPPTSQHKDQEYHPIFARRKRFKWTKELKNELINIWFDTSPRIKNHSQRMQEKWASMHPEYSHMTPKYLLVQAYSLIKASGKNEFQNTFRDFNANHQFMDQQLPNTQQISNGTSEGVHSSNQASHHDSRHHCDTADSNFYVHSPTYQTILEHNNWNPIDSHKSSPDHLYSLLNELHQ